MASASVVSGNNVHTVTTQATLTQGAGDTLTITIGGTGADDFTAFEITGLATLNGTLAITFTGDFKPEVGDVFDIIVFGGISGQFANATGLFGFGDGTVYLEIVQKADRLQLVARSFAPVGSSFVMGLISDSHKQQLGQFLSFSYFNLTSVTVGGKLELGGNAYLAGSFTLTRLTDFNATIGGAAKLLSGFTLVAQGVRLFVGSGGSYWQDSNNDGVIDATDTPNSGSVGFAASGVNVALVWLKPNDSADTARYYAVKATGATASLVGLGSNFTFSLSGLTLDLNRARDPEATAAVAAIDFSVLAGGGYSVAVGTETLVFNANAARERASVALAQIQISNFVSFAGALAVDFPGASDFKLTNDTTVNVSVLALTMTGVRAFVGIDGPYWQDSNNDGVIDATDTPNAAAVGVAVEGVDLALALLTPTDKTITARYYALNLSGNSAALVGVNQVTLTANRFTASVNNVAGVAAGSPVVNFAALDGGGLTLATGGAQAFLDFADVVLRGAAEDALLVIANFVYVRGGFAFDSSPQVSELLADNSTRVLDVLLIGASQAYVFVGLGGPYWTDSNNDGRITAADTPVSTGAIGFALGGVDVALVLLRQTGVADAVAVEYTALKARADSAKFVGLGNNLTIEAKNISIEVNRAYDPANVVTAGDFSAMDGGGLTVQTGGQAILIDFDRAVLRASVGDALIQISEFVYLRGGFAFEKGVPVVENLGGGATRDLDVVTIGAFNVHLFAGTGGPYWTDSNNDGVVDNTDTPVSAGAVGLALGGVTFGLAMLRQTVVADPVQYLALKVSAASAAWVGFEDSLTISASDITVQVNRAHDPANLITAGNFTAMTGGGLTVATGGTPVLLDFDRALLRVTVGNAQLKIADFIHITGGFALEKTDRTVTLADGSEVLVKSLTIGGNNLSAFVGINGPASSAQARGFSLTGLNFALGLFTPDKSQTALAGRSWQTLSATATGFTVLGLPSMTVSGTDLFVSLNRALGTPVGVDADATVIHYADAPLVVTTSTTTTISFDFNGARGQVREFGGNLTLSVGSFFHLSGHLAFTRSLVTVKLADNTDLVADTLTVGGRDLTAFAGVNGPGNSANAIGLTLTGVEFALALFSEKLAVGDTTTIPARWLALRATATNVAFVGITGVTLSASDLEVGINRQLDLGIGQSANVIDFATTTVAVRTSATTSLSLNFAGTAGQFTEARGRLQISLFGFLQFSGGLAFSRSDGSVRLSDGTDVAVDRLTLGGSGIDAF
ncbi:MAG: hypothetical protein Q8M02_02585, partial [Candidatus Didemnitutus sp.]|nr:hypothetical protein [Candidatus Didemnitutus sp.]